MNSKHLHTYCNSMNQREVQNFGVNFGAWMYGLNQGMTIEDLYREGERYLAIDPRVALDYRQQAEFHAAILCGYEERRLGR